MKIKTVINPDFDFVCGYIGGFDDIPTKQDKFKPIKGKVLYYKDNNGNEKQIEGQIYVLNNKAKALMQKFEAKFIPLIEESLKSEHPYKKPIQLEVIINIKMSEKRLKNVDADNLAKSVLDFMNGRVFEDDSQVRSLFVYKDIIKGQSIPIEGLAKNIPIPELSGIIVGVRILDNRPSLLSGVQFYDFVEISDEEYDELNKQQN